MFLWDAILSFFPAYIANLLLCSFFLVFSFVFGEVVWKMDCTDPILSPLSGLNVCIFICFFILSYWYWGMVGQCLPVYPSIFEEKVVMTWRYVPLLQDTYDRFIVNWCSSGHFFLGQSYFDFRCSVFLFLHLYFHQTCEWNTPLVFLFLLFCFFTGQRMSISRSSSLHH